MWYGNSMILSGKIGILKGMHGDLTDNKIYLGIGNRYGILFIESSYNGGAAVLAGNHYSATTIVNHQYFGGAGKDDSGDWWVQNGGSHRWFFIGWL